VLPQTLELIQICLLDYQSYAGKTLIYIESFKKYYVISLGNTEGYFVVILIRREMFKVHGSEIIAYPGTAMNRNLLIVHVDFYS
jgi:hypothetical protein